MKKKIIIIAIISVVVICTGLFVYFHFFQKKNDTSPEETTAKSSLGTWWWNKNLDVEEYSTFAKQNGVTEIYYCDYSFSNNVANFVETVCKKGFKVYLLAGEKEWLEDRTDLDNLIENYIGFQSSHQYKFSGIHLDVEPHQFSWRGQSLPLCPFYPSSSDRMESYGCTGSCILAWIVNRLLQWHYRCECRSHFASWLP